MKHELAGKDKERNSKEGKDIDAGNDTLKSD